MSIKAVLDSSTIVALYTPEEHSKWVREVIKGHLKFHILDLAFYEVANALWKKFLLLREISRGEASKAIQGAWRFMDMLCSIHSLRDVREEAWDLSIRHALTIYDSSYLALAKSLNAKLVTTDKTLHEKLRKTTLREILVHPWKTK